MSNILLAFRRLFLTRLTRLHKAGRRAFFDPLASINNRQAFHDHVAPALQARWAIYAKPPFVGPQAGPPRSSNPQSQAPAGPRVPACKDFSHKRLKSLAIAVVRDGKWRTYKPPHRRHRSTGVGTCATVGVGAMIAR